jgi:hypothetical protein
VKLRGTDRPSERGEQGGKNNPLPVGAIGGHGGRKATDRSWGSAIDQH